MTGHATYEPGPLATAASFAAIFGLCVSAVHFSPGDSDVAAWWPAAGVGTGLLVLSRARRWPLLLLLTVVVTGLANVVGDRTVLVSGLFGLANASEGLVVAVLLGAHRSRPWLRTRGDFARLIVATTAGATTIGLLAGGIVHVVLGGPWLGTTFDVMASHGASQLLVIPVALLLTDPRATGRRGLRPRLGAVVQIVATLTITALVYRSGQTLPISFLPLPLLVWGALVLSLRAVAAEALAVGALTTVLTVRGGGPFGDIVELSNHTTAALVQLNLIVIALATLPLALVAAERESALREAIAGREASRRAQDELRQQQEFTAALLDATTGTSIVAADSHGVITFVNRGTESLLGLEAADLIGRDLTSLHLPRELEQRAGELGVGGGLAALTAEVHGTGRPERRDWTYVGADGVHLTMNLNLSPLRDADGARIGYLAVGEDVTAREQVQESLRHALEKERDAVDRLSELDRSKSEFLATVSHELRTPMTSILGFNQILSGEVVGPLNERQRDLLRRVDRGGQRLFGLIENILALSRVETMKDRSSHVEVDLASVVRNAVEATEHLRWDRALTLDVQVSTTGSPTVLGDPTQLERAMVNLVSNATKFTADGGSIRVKLDLDAPHEVSIEVADDGIGIPADEQDHLFDSFFRASNAVAGTIQGTGLGLTIVRTIVEAHDGALTLRSAPDEGTTVTITVPRTGNGSRPPEPDQDPSSSRRTRDTSSPASKGLTT